MEEHILHECFLIIRLRQPRRKQRVECLVEFGHLTLKHFHDAAIPVDNDFGGIGTYTQFHSHVVVAFFIAQLGPDHTFLLYCLAPCILLVVAVDANKLHLSAILIIILAHFGHAFHAPIAPGSPEIEHYRLFSTERTEAHFAPVDVGKGEVGSHCPFGETPLVVHYAAHGDHLIISSCQTVAQRSLLHFIGKQLVTVVKHTVVVMSEKYSCCRLIAGMSLQITVIQFTELAVQGLHLPVVAHLANRVVVT